MYELARTQGTRVTSVLSTRNYITNNNTHSVNCCVLRGRAAWTQREVHSPVDEREGIVEKVKKHLPTHLIS